MYLRLFQRQLRAGPWPLPQENVPGDCCHLPPAKGILKGWLIFAPGSSARCCWKGISGSPLFPATLPFQGQTKSLSWDLTPFPPPIVTPPLSLLPQAGGCEQASTEKFKFCSEGHPLGALTLSVTTVRNMASEYNLKVARMTPSSHPRVPSMGSMPRKKCTLVPRPSPKRSPGTLRNSSRMTQPCT